MCVVVLNYGHYLTLSLAHAWKYSGESLDVLCNGLVVCVVWCVLWLGGGVMLCEVWLHFVPCSKPRSAFSIGFC